MQTATPVYTSHKLADSICDYIPFVSTASSIMAILAKKHILGSAYENDCHIVEVKSTYRLTIALVPVVGNLALAIYDFASFIFGLVFKPKLSEKFRHNIADQKKTGKNIKEYQKQSSKKVLENWDEASFLKAQNQGYQQSQILNLSKEEIHTVRVLCGLSSEQQLIICPALYRIGKNGSAIVHPDAIKGVAKQKIATLSSGDKTIIVSTKALELKSLLNSTLEHNGNLVYREYRSKQTWCDKNGVRWIAVSNGPTTLALYVSVPAGVIMTGIKLASNCRNS